jgi:hypothetical protein
MSAAIVAVVLASVCGQAETAPQKAERQESQQHMKERAAALVLQRDPADKEPFRLTAEPVLHYSNAEREIGSLDGLTYLWLAGERPVAAVSLSIRRLKYEVYHEFTSFVGQPLLCRSGDSIVWSPKTGGLLAQPIADAPVPAEGKPQRLVQIRALARRFTANCYHSRTDEPTELRLLTQPLYRYADAQQGIVDGAMFAFVVSNDPELFLVVEAVKADGGTEPRWQYSLARMSSQKLTVRLDDKEAWSVGNYYQSPPQDRKTGPYAEARVGTFMPPSAAPE